MIEDVIRRGEEDARLGRLTPRDATTRYRAPGKTGKAMENPRCIALSHGFPLPMN